MYVCLSATLVYCGQTAERIQTKLGLQVGIGPGHIVLDGDPGPPPPTGHSRQFLAHICCGKMASWIKIPLGIEVGLGPGDFVLDGYPAPVPKRGRSPPILSPCLLCPKGWMDQDTIWYGSRPQLRRHCVRWEPSSFTSHPPKKGHNPQFSAHVYCGQMAVSRRHCVRWGPNSPSGKGAQPTHAVFGQCPSWPNGCMD